MSWEVEFWCGTVLEGEHCSAPFPLLHPVERSVCDGKQVHVQRVPNCHRDLLYQPTEAQPVSWRPHEQMHSSNLQACYATLRLCREKDEDHRCQACLTTMPDAAYICRTCINISQTIRIGFLQLQNSLVMQHPATFQQCLVCCEVAIRAPILPTFCLS